MKDFIDPVDYVKRTIPNEHGDLQIEGLTVRSLIKVLQVMDPDDLVCYMAEQTKESRKQDVLIGATAGVLGESPLGVCFIIGPEAVRAMGGRQCCGLDMGDPDKRS